MVTTKQHQLPVLIFELITETFVKRANRFLKEQIDFCLNDRDGEFIVVNRYGTQCNNRKKDALNIIYSDLSQKCFKICTQKLQFLVG